MSSTQLPPWACPKPSSEVERRLAERYHRATHDERRREVERRARKALLDSLHERKDGIAWLCDALRDPPEMLAETRLTALLFAVLPFDRVGGVLARAGVEGDRRLGVLSVWERECVAVELLRPHVRRAAA